jgi:hypothetical protein
VTCILARQPAGPGEDVPVGLDQRGRHKPRARPARLRPLGLHVDALGADLNDPVRLAGVQCVDDGSRLNSLHDSRHQFPGEALGICRAIMIRHGRQRLHRSERRRWPEASETDRPQPANPEVGEHVVGVQHHLVVSGHSYRAQWTWIPWMHFQVSDVRLSRPGLDAGTRSRGTACWPPHPGRGSTRACDFVSFPGPPSGSHRYGASGSSGRTGGEARCALTG